jgi:alpha-D-ribose 1-methylphosphonate 5-triphosphate synthase subunit PhnL
MNCLRRNSTAATRSSGGRLSQWIRLGRPRASSVKVVTRMALLSKRKSTGSSYQLNAALTDVRITDRFWREPIES